MIVKLQEMPNIMNKINKIRIVMQDTLRWRKCRKYKIKINKLNKSKEKEKDRNKDKDRDRKLEIKVEMLVKKKVNKSSQQIYMMDQNK